MSCHNNLEMSWNYSEILLALKFEEDFSKELLHYSEHYHEGSFVPGCVIVSLFIESRKVYGVVGLKTDWLTSPNVQAAVTSKA